jgi:hypothetical protein
MREENSLRSDLLRKPTLAPERKSAIAGELPGRYGLANVIYFFAGKLGAVKRYQGECSRAGTERDEERPYLPLRWPAGRLELRSQSAMAARQPGLPSAHRKSKEQPWERCSP